MDIQVLVEPVAGGGFRATAFGLSAEGASREAAVEHLQQRVTDELARGVSFATVQVPVGHPCLRFAGTWKADDPVIQEWLEILEENRQKADRELEGT